MAYQVTFAFLALVIVSIGALHIPQPLPSDEYLERRIVGGREADISEFPYQISLEINNQPMCGGSILSNIYVLTAAHCLPPGVAPEAMLVRAGTSIVLTGGQAVRVLNYQRHPSYRGPSANFDYDIAILKVQPLSFNNNVRPVSLASGSEAPDGTGVVVSGWGRIIQDGPPSRQLRAVDLSILNWNQCNSANNNVLTRRMICAGYLPGGKGSCQGDSGGPLVANGVQYGIVSWGRGCAQQNLPTVYASVVSLRDYITQVTGL